MFLSKANIFGLGLGVAFVHTPTFHSYSHLSARSAKCVGEIAAAYTSYPPPNSSTPGVLYSRYCEFDRLCTTVVSTKKFSGPLFGKKKSPREVPRVGVSCSKLLSLGTSQGLRAQLTGTFLRSYALRGITIQCFDIAGTYILACALGVRYCSYSQYSQL